MPLQRVLKFIGLYFAASILATAGMLLYSVPYHPKSLSGWALFFLLALPITIAGEAIGEAIWRNPIARRIESKTTGQSVSWLRLCYGFVVMLVVFGTVCIAASLFGLQK